MSSSNHNEDRITDYVLVYEANDLSLHYPRFLFEQAMEDECLTMEREVVNDFVFVRVSVPFHRLALQAERIKYEMPLKGLEIPPSMPGFMSAILKVFVTDDEVDFVSAPFEVLKQQLFEGIEDEQTFFRTAVRSFLTHNILINIDIHKQLREKPDEDPDEVDGLRRRGLLYLLMKKAYVDAYTLHDASADEPILKRIKERSLDDYYKTVSHIKSDPRREMDRSWTKCCKFQPLWKIRNYFGEKIAFYFAWQGTFLTVLWIPALIGIAVFGYGLYESVQVVEERKELCDNSTAPQVIDDAGNVILCTTVETPYREYFEAFQESFDNRLSAFFALIICLWGCIFLEIWKRNQYTLAYQWDSDNYEYSEPDRPEFVGTRKDKDPVTGLNEWIYPPIRRLLKFAISFVVASLAVCAVFASVASVVVYKVYMRVMFNCTRFHDDQPEYRGSAAVCLTTCTIAPTIMNSLSIMILGFFYDKIVHKLTDLENHRTQSDYSNALIIKLFAFQFANTYTSLFYIAFLRPTEFGFQDGGIFGWGQLYQDTCDRGSCMSLLSLQVLVLMVMKPFPKLYKDYVWPYILNYMKTCRRKYKGRSTANKIGATEMGNDEGKTAGDDNIQLTARKSMAASSLDSEECGPNKSNQAKYKDIWREWRKPPVGDFSLGEFNEKIIQFGYIVMFASSFPLAPFLALVLGLLDIRMDAKRLLWFNRRPVAFVAADIGMWFTILRFLTLCGVLSNAFIVAYTSDFCHSYFGTPHSTCTNYQRMTIAVAFENLMLAAMYVISGTIPDIPRGIKLAQRRERYTVAKVLERGYVPGLEKCEDGDHNVLSKQNDTNKKSQRKDGLVKASEKDDENSPKASNMQSERWSNRIHRQTTVEDQDGHMPHVETPQKL